MNNDSYRNGNVELNGHRHLVCWRSALAGVVIGLVTMIGLLALSVAFGGIGLDDGSTVKNATIFAGVSIVVALIVGNFTGSYYSVRIARRRVDVVGVMQGLLVGGICVLLMVCHTMASVAMLGKVTGSALGAAASTAGGIAATQAPVINDMIQDSLGNRKLAADADVIVKGLASRLVRGDQESAKNYLAAQAGMTPEEADKAVATLKEKTDKAMEETRKAAATTLKAVGWSSFVMIVLAMIAAALGGMVGAVCNERRMIDVAR
ncbi:YrzE family protein [Bdellovibrio sp. SKB1291214]|uniref:YrzE family protein n=1 Tax=Bdellovibrio sp. SKB1291214 TaxID=1732569 RepID=UPI000B518978|nr:YrzE family protein [Bdellovibrio sp. SKB1291214]UYL07880.1 YrzE family protein [Bdellovibrio sp. SKB1291214]